MTGIVDWAASRARMIMAFIALSILAGTVAYLGLPKEGEPDIEIPAVVISVPFPGISAEDAATIRPMFLNPSRTSWAACRALVSLMLIDSGVILNISFSKPIKCLSAHIPNPPSLGRQ